MKFIPTMLLMALLSSTAIAQSPPDSPAMLRCDPATVIEDIDGASRSYYAAGDGAGFKECAIPLSTGPHVLRVCFSLGAVGTTSIGGANVAYGGQCVKARELSVDARPGRTYRIRFDLVADWKAFIEDVTEAEAGLSYAVPPEKPKPKGSKKDRETILVFRASPENAYFGMQKGVIRGKWFDVGRLGGLQSSDFSRKGVPAGYHVYRALAGDTVGLSGGQMMGGSVLEIHSISPCGDFKVRVYEDLPAGKVLYLGHLTLRDGPGGYVGTYTDDDLAEARAYIDAHHPDLAGRLEAVPFREARTANICFGTGYDLLPGH
jgi:hypothetical protein